uniref:Uncharacterized protein n=1 Tax=Arundo donax TaxID=35708 RepID=A0A0A9HZ31_ARUDO
MQPISPALSSLQREVPARDISPSKAPSATHFNKHLVFSSSATTFPS